MKRFGIHFDEKNNITLWDYPLAQPMTSGGEPLTFPADQWREAERVSFVMNQRVEKPELTRADGKLVSMSNA